MPPIASGGPFPFQCCGEGVAQAGVGEGSQSAGGRRDRALPSGTLGQTHDPGALNFSTHSDTQAAAA